MRVEAVVRACATVRELQNRAQWCRPRNVMRPPRTSCQATGEVASAMKEERVMSSAWEGATVAGETRADEESARRVREQEACARQKPA